MPNPAEQSIPAPHETAPQPENDEVIKRLATPEASRIIAGVVDKKFLNPGEKVHEEDQERFRTWTANKTPENIDYRAVESISVDSRKDYWKDKEGDFESQKKEWNDGVSKWIKGNTAESAGKRDDVLATLDAIGIKIDKDNVEENLSDKVESFRGKYFDGKSDIKQFVADIANGCKDGDNLDLAKLETRLDAVKGLLSSFGQSDGIPDLVKDYSAAHALLSQNEEKKKVVAEEVYNHTKDPMPDDAPERPHLEKLYTKQQELGRISQSPEPTTEPKPPTDEGTPQTETPDADKPIVLEEGQRFFDDETNEEILIDKIDEETELVTVITPDGAVNYLPEQIQDIIRERNLTLKPSEATEATPEEPTPAATPVEAEPPTPQEYTMEPQSEPEPVTAKPKPSTPAEEPNLPTTKDVRKPASSQGDMEQPLTPYDRYMDEPDASERDKLQHPRPEKEATTSQEADAAAEPKPESPQTETPTENTGFAEEQAFVSKNENGTEHKIVITHIDKETGEVTIQTENGNEEKHSQQSLKELIKEEDFEEVSQSEPIQATEEPTKLEQPKAEESNALEPNQRFTYMGSVGTIESVEDDLIRVKYDDGSSGPIMKTNLEKPERKFSLLDKSDSTNDESNNQPSA